jgi:hypothetical protein
VTSRDPPRAMSRPTTMNSIPVDRPWLTMYSADPAKACVEKAKIPSAMNPKCAIEV